jgi:hypothetical protein
MTTAMSDAIFFTLMGLLAAGAIALAAQWPQGLGARSPEPFGHTTAAELRARQADPTLKGAF